MALDRTISVKLKADIAGYVASLKQAGAQTASFAKGIEQGAIKQDAPGQARHGVARGRRDRRAGCCGGGVTVR